MQTQSQHTQLPTSAPMTRVHEMPVAGPGALEITFRVHRTHAPALRSAIDEIREEIGGRLEGAHSFAKEDALTRASIALGSLAAAVNRAVPTADADY